MNAKPTRTLTQGFPPPQLGLWSCHVCGGPGGHMGWPGGDVQDLEEDGVRLPTLHRKTSTLMPQPRLCHLLHVMYTVQVLAVQASHIIRKRTEI